MDPPEHFLDYLLQVITKTNISEETDGHGEFNKIMSMAFSECVTHTF